MAAYYEHAVGVLARDDETGALSFVEVQRDGVGDVEGLTGARIAVTDPLGKHLYVAGTADSALVLFDNAILLDGFESGDTTRW